MPTPDPNPMGAAAQRQAVLGVIADLERNLVDLSNDQAAFSAAESRRARLLREAARLAFLEQKERAADVIAHQQALVERLTDVRRHAAEQQADAAVVNAAMRSSIDKIVVQARRAQAIGIEVERLARQETIALDALHRAGIKVENHKPSISTAGLDQAAVLRLYAAAHAVLRAKGIAANSPVALGACQNLAKI